MNILPPFQNPEFLKKEQYRNSRNLAARAGLHRRFSTAAIPWHKWVFQQLNLRPGSRILECGCGPGWLWRNNLGALPPDCRVTLTDLSGGMVAEAQVALAGCGRNFHFGAADIQELPFASSSFDRVIANHMLYHVPDGGRALAEARRVLRSGGRFYAATVGSGHMRELRQIAQKLFPGAAGDWLQMWSLDSGRSFQLENGAEQLAAVFSHVTLLLYEDSLEVTTVAPLITYLRSSSSMPDKAALAGEKEAQLRRELQERIDRDGAIHITKETGLFVSW